VRNAADLAAIVELEKKVFKDRDNLLRIQHAEHWIRRFSKAMFILQDSEGHTLGYGKCLPVSETTFGSMWTAGTDIRDWLSPDNILKDRTVLQNAVDGMGNYCYVGAVIFDPQAKAENYRELAVPVWRKFAVIFTRMCFRGLICQSETREEEFPIEHAGCRRGSEIGATRDGRRVVWRFDAERAQEEPTRGLGVVFNNVWPSRYEKAALGLTTKERQVVLLALWAYDDDEDASALESSAWILAHDDAAKILGIASSTVKTHWQNIRTKFRSFHGQEEVPSTRIFERMVIDYCKQHPVELFGRQ